MPPKAVKFLKSNRKSRHIKLVVHPQPWRREFDSRHQKCDVLFTTTPRTALSTTPWYYYQELFPREETKWESRLREIYIHALNSPSHRGCIVQR